MASSVRSLSVDSLLNIIAAAIPIAALQLFVLPSINATVEGEAYGLIVTLISLFTLFPAVLGNTLNNVRLINNKAYEDKGLSGDFNIIGTVLAIIGMVLTMVVGSLYIGEVSIWDIVGLGLVSPLYFLEGYLGVGFLIELNYKRILIRNIFLTGGHVAGLALFWVTGWWYWVYILGYLLAVAYSLARTSLAREPFTATPLFGHIVKSELAILASSWLSNVVTYADRLLLYPLIGGSAVAAYYASTLLGKMISIVIGPVSNVVLAHLGKADSVKKQSLLVGIAVSASFGIAVYFICLIIARPVIGLLYPNLVDTAMTIVAVTTATSIVQSWSSIVNPLVLRFCNLGWQVAISVINIVTYIALALVMYNIWGLMGFALGVLFSAIISLAVRFVVVYIRRDSIVDEKAAL